jgi:2-iminobutanoate/2-iminopropanoate deaminase
VPSIAVVVTHRVKDVENGRTLRAAVSAVLDAAREDVALQRPEWMLRAVHDEHLRAAQDDPELLVRVAVQWDDGARLELDQVQHRLLAEERTAADAFGELERRDVPEPNELRLHRAIIVRAMADREEIRVPGQPEPISHYTDAVRAGELLFVSGCVPVDAEGRVVGGDDVVAQARQVFENLSAVLAAGGAGFPDVVKVTVYLTDVDDRAKINPVRQEFFGDARPASTLVEISRLAVPGAKIEVEAIAVGRGRP